MNNVMRFVSPLWLMDIWRPLRRDEGGIDADQHLHIAMFAYASMANEERQRWSLEYHNRRCEADGPSLVGEVFSKPQSTDAA